MQTEDKNSFLGTEPLGKLLARLAVPTVLAQIVNMLYNIVDRIYIGHIPDVGNDALTGVGVCLPIILFVSAFAALISVGGAPRASICMGRQDNAAAERIMGTCLTAQVVASAILTAVMLIFGRGMLMAFGASVNTIDYALDYIRIYAIGTVFVQITMGMNAYITAQGFAKVGMYTVLIGAILNIVLDPVFIFALHLGVKGAAIATVISQAVSCVWVLIFLSGDRTTLRIRRGNLRLDFKVLLPCIALGISPFIMQSSESVISVCFNSSLQRYGGDMAVGAMTILSSVMQFANLPLSGLAQGAQPITGYNFGAGNRERVKGTFFLLLKVSLAYSVTLWALVMLFPSVFAGVFTPDNALRAFTAPALRVFCASMWIFGLQMSCQMTFVAIGNAVSSIMAAVMRKFILLLPLIYIMPRLVSNKTMGVYMAEPVADFLAVIFTVSLFAVQFKKALRGLDKEKTQ